MALEHESEEAEPKRQITPEEYLAERKAAVRRRSWWAIGLGFAAVAVSLAAIWFVLNYPEYFADDLDISGRGFLSLVFRNIFFLLGLFFIVAGFWGLYEAKRLTLEDLIPSPEAVEFFRQAENVQPIFSYIIVACLIAVFVVELAGGTDENGRYLAMDIAGLVKPDVWTKGEYWRILTSGVLHGGLLHIYFNAQAFYGFASLIEFISNRAHLAIVFLLAIIGGAILSIIFLPVGVSVGASGGIMGLIGYLAIYGYRRQRQLPPDFLRSMLINIGFVAAFGLVAYQIIDNFAHLGGLLTGAAYGFLQIPRDLRKNPRQISAVTEALGLIAIGIFIFISILSILLILQYIKF